MMVNFQLHSTKLRAVKAHTVLQVFSFVQRLSALLRAHSVSWMSSFVHCLQASTLGLMLMRLRGTFALEVALATMQPALRALMVYAVQKVPAYVMQMQLVCCAKIVRKGLP